MCMPCEDKPSNVRKMPYEELTQRLEKALCSINEKTSAFQIGGDVAKSVKEKPMTEFESVLERLVEKAEDLSVSIKL